MLACTFKAKHVALWLHHSLEPKHWEWGGQNKGGVCVCVPTPRTLYHTSSLESWINVIGLILRLFLWPYRMDRQLLSFCVFSFAKLSLIYPL